MIKLSALKEESEESSPEEDVTKEILEQIALQQYAKALELHRKGNLQDATQLLKDLLETELLDEVKTPQPGEKITSPLFNLKYLSYKNLGNMLSISGDVEGSIAAYVAASELDNTDVTLWHRLGLVCLRGKHYDMALKSFQKGVERNPKHWPCLDKIVTLLLALDYKEECIVTICETLKLDPGYLRAIVYRRYIYKTFPYIRQFMEYLNPVYKWEETEDDIDESQADKLLHEVEEIHNTFLEQQKTYQLKVPLPDLDLQKSISKLTWLDVGESLVNMHNYMTENSYSHASYINIVYERKEEELMEVCEDNQVTEPTEKNMDESLVDVEKKEENGDNVTLNTTTETEKINESDVEAPPGETSVENTPTESKKKAPVRRRGSALSMLQQWNWCKNRRSRRKKTVSTKDRLDDNIYETLRRMIPLLPETDNKQKTEDKDTVENTPLNSNNAAECKIKEEYFNTEQENKDVKDFITKYTEKKCDIIDILKEYLILVAEKWKLKWPENLPTVFINANKCYNSHTDIPPLTDDAKDDIFHFTKVNLLFEELYVNEKLFDSTNKKPNHDLSIIDNIGLVLSLKPYLLSGTDILELTLRYYWVKLHINMLNRNDEFGLECLYQLNYEFEAMGEHCEFSLDVANFTFKPVISKEEISSYIRFLERNKKLSTVQEFYNKECYENVLEIVSESFEYCKNMARNHEEEMSLDFAVQLYLILDSYWALGETETCLKWSFTCLHEALKHFFRYTSGSAEYDKWTITVAKILSRMEDILTNEGLSCLDVVSPKDLYQGLEDLIRIIGHQVETNASEMPFGTVVPWIIMHYILQREDDMGRSRVSEDTDKIESDEIPNPLMVLFIAHEQLGNRGWCCISDMKLLYFILDTVVPRLRSPAMAKYLEQVVQYLEQCVYCLFGHPGKKNKLKYLVDHNIKPHALDWAKAQQVYEIFRPPTLPVLEGKVSGISADTEQLFHRILQLLPSECDPSKYVPEIEKYIKGTEKKVLSIPLLLPFKMKDIYHLLGDYYFKKEEGKMAIKYNVLDVILNSDRLESWAEISLAKATNLERLLNSCKNINNEKEVLNTAKCTIRCFKRALELDPSHCILWIEYGIFVYTVHSFCSRLLKQASESLSMDDFELLEKQKENMLDTTETCFMAVLNDMNNTRDSDDCNEDSWLHYYMLGKVTEKRNKSPSVYLDYYMQAVKSLQEAGATYPMKINYNSPTHLCIEVLELQYRIHASILKYIEQHENKPIPSNIGKVFMSCIDQWKNGPFNKIGKKDGTNETDKASEPVHPGNILKRSASDAGEENTHEAKKLKSESAAAKIKRSVSYDTERILNKIQPVVSNTEPTKIYKDEPKEKEMDKANESVTEIQKPEVVKSDEKEEKPGGEITKEKKDESSSGTSSSSGSTSDSSSDSSTDSSRDSDIPKKSVDAKPLTEDEIMTIISSCLDSLEDCASRFAPHYKAIYRLAHYHFYYKKGKDIERCRDLMLSTFVARSGQKLGGLFSERKPSNLFNNIWKIPISEVDRAGGFVFHMSRSVLLTMEILKDIDDHKTLLDMSVHLQRIPDQDKKYLRDGDREELAQQAFSLCIQSLKGQLQKFSQQADLKSNDVERQALKSLMLDIYRAYQKAQKQQQANCKQFTNLLVDAYKLVSTNPIAENANLTDLSLKYCQSLIQSLRQQATQASLDKSQNAQKKPSVKASTSTALISETVKNYPSTSGSTKSDHKTATSGNTKSDHKTAASTSTSSILSPTTSIPAPPSIMPLDMISAFQNYMPLLNAQDISRQTAAAALWSNLSTLVSYNPGIQQKIQTDLQNSLHNSFQAEFFLQYIRQSLSSFNQTPPKPKQKRGPKPGSVRSTPSTLKSTHNPHSKSTPVLMNTSKSTPTTASASQMKMSKSHASPSLTSVPKGPIKKSSSNPLTPSMGTVLSSLPASMSNLSSFGITSSIHTGILPSSRSTPTIQLPSSHHKAMTQNPTTSVKTLQEKLAERQQTNKNNDLNVISKLPNSLTITKTSSVLKQSQNKKREIKKVVPPPAKSKISDEVIVLDDD